VHYAPSKPAIASRRIAILVADGFNGTEVAAVRAALASASATTWIIGARRGTIKPGEGLGDSISADHHFEGQRSTMFDAVFVPSGEEHAKALAGNGRVVHWVREAFGHCKAIGAIGEGELILDPYPDERLLSINTGVDFIRTAVSMSELQLHATGSSQNVVTSYGVVTAGSYTAGSAVVDALTIGPGGEGFASNFAYEISKHRCYERETDGLCQRVAY
jgi:catalase